MQTETTVAIAGFGAIGRTLAEKLCQTPGYRLTAIASRDITALRTALSEQGLSPELAVPVSELAEHAELIIECAPLAAFRQIAEPALRAGKTLLVLTAGALIEHEDLLDLAAQHGAVIAVPSGAIAGLDGVLAAAQGTITSAEIITRKPPTGLGDSGEITRPQLLFAGPVCEAYRQFPANVNVAVTLSLAGIGPDKTRIEVWADPTINRNEHTIRVESDAGYLEVRVSNLPSAANPKTAAMTAQSVMAWLAKQRGALRIGS